MSAHETAKTVRMAEAAADLARELLVAIAPTAPATTALDAFDVIERCFDLAEQYCRTKDRWFAALLSSGTRPRTDDQAPAQAALRPGGDRAAQGRSGGRDGA